MNEALTEALALLKASGLASSEPIPPIPSQVGIGVTGQEGVNQGFSVQPDNNIIAAPPVPTFAGSSGQPPFDPSDPSTRPPGWAGAIGSGIPEAEGDGAVSTAWQPMSGSQMIMRAINLLENADTGGGGSTPPPSPSPSPSGTVIIDPTNSFRAIVLADPSLDLSSMDSAACASFFLNAAVISGPLVSGDTIMQFALDSEGRTIINMCVWNATVVDWGRFKVSIRGNDGLELAMV